MKASDHPYLIAIAAFVVGVVCLAISFSIDAPVKGTFKYHFKTTLGGVGLLCVLVAVGTVISAIRNEDKA
jgi:fructose-specific phosphotransferase system IIC component